MTPAVCFTWCRGLTRRPRHHSSKPRAFVWTCPLRANCGSGPIRTMSLSDRGSPPAALEEGPQTRRKSACLVPAPSGRHDLSLGPWRPRPWQTPRGFAVNGPLQASNGRMKVSSLGYGPGSRGLLNVVFLAGMLYSGRRKADRRPPQQPRAAGQGSSDPDARIARGSRADRRRPRTDCDWRALSPHAPARRSRSARRRRAVCVRVPIGCSTPLLTTIPEVRTDPDGVG